MPDPLHDAGQALVNLDCPCGQGHPCSPMCSCANGIYSGGCMRCCRYGSDAQRKEMATRIVGNEIAIQRKIAALQSALSLATAQRDAGLVWKPMSEVPDRSGRMFVLVKRVGGCRILVHPAEFANDPSPQWYWGGTRHPVTDDVKLFGWAYEPDPARVLASLDHSVAATDMIEPGAAEGAEKAGGQ